MTHGRLHGVLILLASLAFSANAAKTLPGEQKEFPAVPGQYVVKLKSSSAKMTMSNLGQALGAQVIERVSKVGNLILVQRSTVETRASSIQSLAHNPMVEYAEPNYIYKIVGGTPDLPNDPELGRLWGMINNGATATDSKAVAGVDIDAKRAWTIETGSADVKVAVIDTGVKHDHADLTIFTNTVEANGQAGVDDDANGCIDDIHGCDFNTNDGDPMDGHGHGTHCSGTIGAKGNNGVGVVGVAWNVTIVPVRFLGTDGSGTLAGAVKSIDYATALKVNIMSNSWGGGGFSQAMLDSIIRAKAANILFVAAAGNESGNNDTNPAYPASYQVDNVISVAAIDSAGKLATFSNIGKTSVHVAAPGVGVLSYTLTGMEAWSGTSMATPHVSGIAALLFSQDLTQSYATVKQRILASARPMGSLRNRVAAGMANAYLALTNQTAPLDPNDPYNWGKTPQAISSPHPYANSATGEWTLTAPGAKQIAVSFSKFETERNYDKVEIVDSTGRIVETLSGNLGEIISTPVTGDTVTLRFRADTSVTGYGFDVDGLAVQN